MVNWKKMLVAKNNGGLVIRDNGLLNKTLGTKIMWNVATREDVWWKNLVTRKYTHSNRSGIITIWSLCKASIDIVKIQASWMLGNGHGIRIWEDFILGRIE